MKKRRPAGKRLAKFVRTVLPALVVLLIGVAGLFGFLVYRVTHPNSVSEPLDPSHFLLPSIDVSFQGREGLEIPSWWIPGLKGAPGIVLAPGYAMSRSEALSLAAGLHQAGFNLLVYAQRGSGSRPNAASTMGLREAEEMMSALEYVGRRPEVEPSRLGIWGVDVGARAALRAAVQESRVRAIAVDGAYDAIPDFLAIRIADDTGIDNPILQFGCRQAFRIFEIASPAALSQPLSPAPLADRNILFIQGENNKDLGRLTASLYGAIQPRKEMVSLRTGRVRLMNGEDIANYDRVVSNFFRLSLQRENGTAGASER